MLYCYGVLFFSFIIIVAERFRRRVCRTLGWRIRFLVWVCVSVRPHVSWGYQSRRSLERFLCVTVFLL